MYIYCKWQATKSLPQTKDTMACTDNTTAAIHRPGAATTISAVHPDIIQTHILTRLDGPALASIATTCSQLHALSEHEQLWESICHATWPSTTTPRVRHIISTFPGASRSFFSDSFPSFAAVDTYRHANIERTPELVTAVDLFHGRKPVLSRVVETETVSGWFRCSPFRVDVLDPKEAVATAMEYPRSEEACERLREELRLSWIVVDPEGKRAVNVSSGRAVSVERHWLSGEVRVRFATVVGGGERGSASEAVLCSVTVTCGSEMQVREACVQMEDMDGTILNGRDSLGILQRALEGKRGTFFVAGEKDRFLEFMNRKRERKERKMRDERRLDMACVALALLSFAAISTLFFFRI
ncbi:probable F-box protein At2g36090 [Vigna radiata var. radiata]|uniref:Probable F-box protein At2g36090 n=1 Tax=Vigna radiata var. radiata TaxID=3916 RepID=A0A1S3TNN4_VIGRR|nr:probable F-box protein At2g36090 [Vigna radiata var. radiata]